MKCIYSKKSTSEASFLSQEHIIPAGIGGIEKLPHGIVSDDINKLFSALELEFMRDSLISIPRQFYGPGKRGSLSINHATESKIHVMFNNNKDNEPQLGFIKLAQPYIIPQFYINSNGSSSFRCSNTLKNYENQIEEFVKELSLYNDDYIFIHEELLQNDFIIGCYKNKFYYSSSNKEKYSDAIKYIEAIKKNSFFKKTEPIEIIDRVKVNVKTSYNFNAFDRICAKIIFNFLCLSQGADYVLKKSFDPIRNWIINGGDNFFVKSLDPEQKLDISKYLNSDYPEASHKIIIFSDGTNILGIITFYGNFFSKIVNLSDKIDGNQIFDGIICDWKNRKEIRLLDFIGSFNV